MKIRNGFVSNSSSSSFIFGLSGAPANSNDLLLLLYPSGKQYINFPWAGDNDSRVSTQEAASYIYGNMQKASKEDLYDLFRCRYHHFSVEDYFAKRGGISGLRFYSRHTEEDSKQEGAVDLFLEEVAQHNKSSRHEYYMHATDVQLAKDAYEKMRKIDQLCDDHWNEMRNYRCFFW